MYQSNTHTSVSTYAKRVVKLFFKRASLKKHVHHSCKHCTYITHSKNNYKSHKLKHKKLPNQDNDSSTSPDLQSYTCTLCDTILEKTDLFGAHWLEEHMRQQRERGALLKCPMPNCVFTSFRETAVLEHVETQHLKVCHAICIDCHKGSLKKNVLKNIFIIPAQYRAALISHTEKKLPNS